jgi:hypothetical protein
MHDISSFIIHHHHHPSSSSSFIIIIHYHHHLSSSSIIIIISSSFIVIHHYELFCNISLLNLDDVHLDDGLIHLEAFDLLHEGAEHVTVPAAAATAVLRNVQSMPSAGAFLLQLRQHLFLELSEAQVLHAI